MYQASKVKTVCRSNQSGRERVAKNLFYEDEDPLIPEADANRLRHRLRQYETLCNTWALAGTHKVTFEGKEVVFCHWQDACYYANALKAKVEHLTDRYTEQSVLSYLEKVEEKIRGHVIGEVRRRVNPQPWGAALRWALKEHNEEWSENKDVLVRIPTSKGAGESSGRGAGGYSQGKGQRARSRSRSRRFRQSDAGAGSKPQKGGAKGQRQGPLGDTRRAKTSDYTRDNKRFCTAFLNGRCSSSIKCPRGDVHGCNLLLAKSGRPCAQFHMPSKHVDAVHVFLKAA